ncbi:FAD-dependent oxidoreductase [Phytohabitans rumicis]|uniref:FAD-dependent oxidoreductase n=2 Tax=Phytohabitans rumicis TaxID=1076125 RepID=A0A6V8LH15_9ACTN|nr:FAD-dependent oxidoreductase [Phytohabitans rumicis]
MALQKAGIQATVYEAYDGLADGVGAGLSIAPNGLNALGILDADEAVRRIGIPMTAIVLQSWTGKCLAELANPPDLPTMQFVWRPELYRALYDEAARRGIRTEHGKRLVGLADAADGVTAHFADGSTAEADVLVGADGIRSATRSLIDPAAPAPRYAGLLNFGGRLDATGLASTGGKMHMVFGKRLFFGYQVNDDGSGGWFINLPRPEPMTLADTRTVPAERWLHTLRDAVTDDRGPAATLLDRTIPDDLMVIGPMEDIPTVPTWSKGRVVLIGDAAHATSPSSGQGASLAIESAVQLARCLRDLPHARAFAAYEGLRRERVEKIIANAARTNSNKAAGPVARVLRDLFLPAIMRSLAKPEKLAWQFGYRIDWDAPVSGPAPVPAR